MVMVNCEEVRVEKKLDHYKSFFSIARSSIIGNNKNTMKKRFEQIQILSAGLIAVQKFPSRPRNILFNEKKHSILR